VRTSIAPLARLFTHPERSPQDYAAALAHRGTQRSASALSLSPRDVVLPWTERVASTWCRAGRGTPRGRVGSRAGVPGAPHAASGCRAGGSPAMVTRPPCRPWRSASTPTSPAGRRVSGRISTTS
jgi:hypothetical protein